MADFRDVVSVLLHAARLIKARKIFVADWQWALVSWYARNINTVVALANWLAPKKDALFSLIYFFGSFAYITFRIIMSFRKPCHMTFRKLIPVCHPHRVSRAFQEVFSPQMPCCFIRIHARLGTAVEMSQPFHAIARFERFTPCLNMHSITFKTGKRMFSNFIRWCLIFNSSYGGRRWK